MTTKYQSEYFDPFTLPPELEGYCDECGEYIEDADKQHFKACYQHYDKDQLVELVEKQAARIHEFEMAIEVLKKGLEELKG